MVKWTRAIAVGVIGCAAASIAACGERDAPHATDAADAEPAVAATAGTATVAAGWALWSSGEGAALRFVRNQEVAIALSCPSRSGQLFVNVAVFEPVASEERLSLGSGGTAVALVADSRGDSARGGVTGETPVPAELGAILAGPISASYGAQSVGPFAPPTPSDRATFLAACQEEAPAAVSPGASPAAASACQMQEGVRLSAEPLRAIGTEPFWGARIDGRCVTYSTPEDQQGTRIWTKYNRGPDGGVWSGALDGRQFELRTRPAPPPACSDGMSDNRYPIAVTLRVRGETRQGCAKRG